LKAINSFMRCLIVFGILILGAASLAAEPPASKAEPESPTIAVPEKMGEALIKEAGQVKEDIQQQVVILARWTPLGWNLKTIDYLYKWLLSLPLRIPEFMQQVALQSRILGIAGSLVIFVFLAAVFYSLFGRNRVMRRIESAIQPVRNRIPEPLYPFFMAALRVVVAAAIPLLLLAVYSAIEAMITYKAPWFALTGDLLQLWSLAALAIALLQQLLTRDLFKTTQAYGNRAFQITRLVLLYTDLHCAVLGGRGVSLPQGRAGVSAVRHLRVGGLRVPAADAQPAGAAVLPAAPALPPLPGLRSHPEPLLLPADRGFFCAGAALVLRFPRSGPFDPGENLVHGRRSAPAQPCLPHAAHLAASLGRAPSGGRGLRPVLDRLGALLPDVRHGRRGGGLAAEHDRFPGADRAYCPSRWSMSARPASRSGS